MDSKFDTICGITEEELYQYFAEPIKEMAVKYCCSVDEIKGKLKDQYDGYHFSENMLDIYNPFSIARIILFLSRNEGNMATQKELEDFLQVSHPTTVTIVKSMEAKKMVKTSFDDADRRMKNVKLIWGNENIYRELEQNAEHMEQKLLVGFSEEEKELFYTFLSRAYKNAVK